jgi:hypothetical protein
MRIALFRARATRCGPLPIDRIPEYIHHGRGQTFQKSEEDRLARYLKTQTKTRAAVVKRWLQSGTCSKRTFHGMFAKTLLLSCNKKGAMRR